MCLSVLKNELLSENKFINPSEFFWAITGLEFIFVVQHVFFVMEPTLNEASSQ